MPGGPGPGLGPFIPRRLHSEVRSSHVQSFQRLKRPWNQEPFTKVLLLLFFEKTKILQHVVSIDTGIIPDVTRCFFVSIVMRKASMGPFTVLAVEYLCAIPILWLCWWIPTYSSMVMFLRIQTQSKTTSTAYRCLYCRVLTVQMAGTLQQWLHGLSPSVFRM